MKTTAKNRIPFLNDSYQFSGSQLYSRIKHRLMQLRPKINKPHLIWNSVLQSILTMFCSTLKILFVLLFTWEVSSADRSSMFVDEDLPITTDNRIKTYIYNPNEIYLLVLHFGFQSHIEFARGEEIQTISLGDSYAWKITPLANRLFIKPLEKNIRTNMTILTNKRTYQFDIVSRELDDQDDQDLVYVVRFAYPSKKIR